MSWKSLQLGAVCCLALAALPTVALAQDRDADINRLEKKVSDLVSQIAELRDQQQQGQAETDVSFDELDEQLAGMTRDMSGLSTGDRDFIVTGNAFGGFTDAENQDSSFSSTLEPIFLWKMSDRVFMEGEVEFEFGSDVTESNLEYAQMSYVLNDAMILGFGKFLNPANTFAQNLHPAWINKLPGKPLAMGDQRIMPFTQTGIQLHGGVPMGSQKLNYSVYVSNGPTLEEGSGNYGSLSYHNFTDSNNSKAVGGRVGFFPLPEVELGYSIERSQVTSSGSEVTQVDATIQAVDVGYVGTVGPGTLDVRGQWAFSHVDNAVFDPTGSAAPPFGPVALNNNRRNGGYVQVAFRPSEAENEVVSRFEGVIRYSKVDLPTGAPEGTDETRRTIGVNYWTGSSSVFKLAYRKDNTDAPGMSSDAVEFQWAVGL